MAWQFTFNGTANSSVNNAVATGATAAFVLKEMLKQNGWTVPSSSDGTTFNSSGDQITTGNSGAGGMANNNAWWRVRDPSGVREMLYQRGTGNTVCRWKWSHSARFTGGSPSATVTPSATDEILYRGGGTDASPTFATVWGTDGAYRLHCGGDAAAPYDWWYYTTISAGGATSFNGWYVNMTPGTYEALDAAPYVISLGSSGAVTAPSSNGAALGTGYHKKGLTGEAVVTFFSSVHLGFNGTGLVIIPAASATAAIGVNPYSGNDSGFPIFCGRAAINASFGWKGVLKMSTVKFPGIFQSQFYFTDETAPAWTISTAYSVVGTLVSNGGNVYRVVTAGTSAGSGGPTGTGNAITDNTVVWAFVAEVARYTLLDVFLFRSPVGVVLS